MSDLFVVDTVSLISYFENIFQEPCRISEKAQKIIHKVIVNYDSNLRLSIPAIVLVEIYTKWCYDEELSQKIKFEIYEVIKQNPNIEIKPIDKEVLENFILLEDEKINLENHDRIILASAMMLDCPLITNDPKIIRFVKRNKNVPRIIS